MKTAKEMKAIADAKNFNVDEVLKKLEYEITTTALLGKFQLKYYGNDFGSGNCYHSRPNENQQKIIDELRKLGYKADVQAEERQFVDIYLLIDWS